MTIENDFLVWAPGSGANVPTQAAYVGSSVLLNGVQTGIASSQLYNKTLRQSSVFASVWAQFIVAQTGQPAIDDGTTATILANVTNALFNIGAAASCLVVSGSTVLSYSQLGYVELKDPSAGAATYTVTFPDPSGTAWQGLPIPRFTIYNNSNTAQDLTTLGTGGFFGPAATGGMNLVMNPGDIYSFWSTGYNWITTIEGTDAQQPGGKGIANITAFGAFTWTVPNGVTSIDVIMTAPGGAGGGANSATFSGSTAAAGGGGGSGATAIFKAAVTPGQVLSGTVGSLATGAINGSGGNGGNVSFLGVTVSGGQGGVGGAAGNNAGGAGGSVSGSPLGLLGAMTTIPGSPGQDGQLNVLFCGGMGAASYWGGGSRAAGGSISYVSATVYGAGGGGIYAPPGGAAGGGGGPPLVQIKW